MVGVLSVVFAVAIGGVVGTFFGHLMSDKFKDDLNSIFGLISICMGLPAVVQMNSMPVVVFATIIGTAIGLKIHFGDMIYKGGVAMNRLAGRIVPAKHSGLSEEEFNNTLITIIVLFCASSTGIYGSIIAGMTGDVSILISKSILDIFTAAIFASILGLVVAFIAIPQLIIFGSLFALAGFILPLTTPEMICDFKAVGGIMMLATGFRILKIRNFPTADMIIGMIITMPISWMWTSFVMPLL